MNASELWGSLDLNSNPDVCAESQGVTDIHPSLSLPTSVTAVVPSGPLLLTCQVPAVIRPWIFFGGEGKKESKEHHVIKKGKEIRKGGG